MVQEQPVVSAGAQARDDAGYWHPKTSPPRAYRMAPRCINQCGPARSGPYCPFGACLGWEAPVKRSIATCFELAADPRGLASQVLG